MSFDRKIWWLRFTEKSLVTLIILFVCLGLWRLATAAYIDDTQLRSGVVALVLLLLALLVLQTFVDRFFKVAISLASQKDVERFQSLYERSPTAHLTIERRGNIIQANPAAVKLLGSTVDQLINRNFFDMIAEYEGHDIAILTQRIKAGGTVSEVELKLKAESGGEVWVQLSTHADPQTNNYIVSLMDVTQAKRVDTAKSEFLALATHQLRTPSAAIRWNAELLQKKLAAAGTEAENRYLDKIYRNVIRMITLIDDFLSVSKLEMGTFASETEVIGLSEYFSSIIDEFSERIAGKNITIVREEEPADFQFLTDRSMFHIVISNLVSNAVKYTRDKGHLTLSYRVVGKQLVVEVVDDGIGIPPSEQQRLFTKFFRASNALKFQTEGTGLGLYVVKQSVEHLGGTISVSSQEDKGTTFTISLPIT